MTDNLRLRAQVKRFRERWVADDRFRAAVLADPKAASDGAGFGIDPAPLAFLWRRGAPVHTSAPESRAYRQVIEDRAQEYFDFVADDGGAISRYRAWRARQQARSAFAQGVVLAPISLHLPFAIELTRGCSLGCWFCGLSASPGVEAVLPTDPDAFEAVLRALRRVFGASGGRGFLFWATDPLDHPDYEAHAEVFRGVFGRFPTTTTAAPMADLARTRRLMRQARNSGCSALRFSVVSRRRLDQIHAAFSAEELVDVELVMVNRESLLALAEAGHARTKARRRPERAALERRKLNPHDGDESLAHRTIACVSGFLIEPLAGRIRLISPEPSSDRWPDGYAVFDEAHFEDPAGFARALDDIVARSMSSSLPERVALQRGVTVEAVAPRVVRAAGRGHSLTIRARRDLAHLPALAEAFRGGAEVRPAVERTAHRFGIDARLARKDAAELWRHGVLIEPFFAFADCGETPAAHKSFTIRN